MIFDLHVHTIFSDGRFTPEQIIDLASRKGIDGIAITDHDTIQGIESAINYSKAINSISVVPGIEFGLIHDDAEVHILGYFIDYKSKKLAKVIDKLANNRNTRGIRIINRINELGMELTLNEVNAFAKKNIGRPHIAMAMVKRGYVKSIEVAFDKWLNRGKPAYIERDSFKLNEIIDLIHKTGGLAVLAHPGILKDERVIQHSVNLGIDGLEIIHPKHSKDDIKKLINISKKYGLIMTGGSDCHGIITNGKYLLGMYYININDMPKMRGRL